MKYKCVVGSFCTRMITRTITVNAKTEEEAMEKAIDKYTELEMRLDNSNDVGSPQVDEIEECID